MILLGLCAVFAALLYAIGALKLIWDILYDLYGWVRRKIKELRRAKETRTGRWAATRGRLVAGEDVELGDGVYVWKDDVETPPVVPAVGGGKFKEEMDTDEVLYKS